MYCTGCAECFSDTSGSHNYYNYVQSQLTSSLLLPLFLRTSNCIGPNKQYTSCNVEVREDATIHFFGVDSNSY